jgi:hypothetical protein
MYNQWTPGTKYNTKLKHPEKLRCWTNYQSLVRAPTQDIALKTFVGDDKNFQKFFYRKSRFQFFEILFSKVGVQKFHQTFFQWFDQVTQNFGCLEFLVFNQVNCLNGVFYRKVVCQ